MDEILGLRSRATSSRNARATSSESAVILDNLASHKVAGVREAIEARAASLVYLPPYSPDLDPIEQAFAKLKAPLRKLAARTVHALWDALGDILARFTPQECANYLVKAGYVPLQRSPL